MVKVKEIFYDGNSVGVLGEKVPSNLHSRYEGELHVGDLVTFTWSGKSFIKHLIKSDECDSFGFMGLGLTDVNYMNMKKLAKWENFDEEVFFELIDNIEFEVKEYEIKELTLEEIEKELGYKFKLIK